MADVRQQLVLFDMPLGFVSRGRVGLMWVPPVPDVRQLPLWPLPLQQDVGTCPDCDQLFTNEELAEGLWGRCRSCEEDRLQDIWAG